MFKRMLCTKTITQKLILQYEERDEDTMCSGQRALSLMLSSRRLGRFGSDLEASVPNDLGNFVSTQVLAQTCSLHESFAQDVSSIG
jgi:hypothetical protein